MKSNGVHILPAKINGQKWVAKLNGKNQQGFKKQLTAIKFGTKLAKKKHTVLVIHGRDGKVREKNSFGA